MAPGTYYWTAWEKFVQVGLDHAYNWRSGKFAKGRTLCVLPFPGFPLPIKITPRIAGEFYGPASGQE